MEVLKTSIFLFKVPNSELKQRTDSKCSPFAFKERIT